MAGVGQEVGYGSPFAFSHAFKRILGSSPGRYRADIADRLPLTSA